MELNVTREVAALKRMTVAELRERYAEVFGEPTTCRHKAHLWKRIIWRMQANAEGGLPERARRRAEELADDADLRIYAPKGGTAPAGEADPARTTTGTLVTNHDPRLPLPGSVLRREYKGRTVEVWVLDRGFEYRGEYYRSLSAVARAVTGSHWNGYDFFGLGRRKGDT